MALINGEPGSEVVERAAAEDDTTISAINYSEALQKATRHGVAPEDVDAALDALGVTVPSGATMPAWPLRSTATAPA